MFEDKKDNDVKQDIESTLVGSARSRWSQRLLSWGVEGRGIIPVAPEDRIDTQYYKNFFLWFAWNVNILSFSAGTLGPVSFGLGVRDSCLVILFFNLLCALPPAYLTTWGPQLGLRQMVQARYSFGYFGVIVPCILNLIGMCGFCILNCILGGQTLSSVADGNLSWTVGIVVISIISLLVSFCGIKVIGWYERVAWIPVVIVFVVALGVSGKHITAVPAAEPATAAAVLSFGSTIAGFVITFSPLSSDFTIYFRPEVSRVRLFLYSYIGLLLPIVTLQCLGAAVAASASFVPAWNEGYAGGNVGGLLEAMLQPVGNFGKFLTVLLSISVAGNIAPTLYSMCLNIQVFIPVWYLVPRYIFSILATAIVLPLSIVGSHRFYDTLTNFLGLIGYWASAFIAVILVEHFVFRRNNPASYDVSCWNKPSALPWGWPAICASVGSFGLVVPCMEQIWFVGPIAKTTGDIGFEVAFAVTALLYLPLRAADIRLRKAV
ncbi:permease for cytosine/purines, uracil, thiamine, allantoin-domain-containing protein [Armillaria novae-zelandiae]|uniref:Permease for cytosine/purines, uracil, thiamine, allantoin-domain-containing protein n=1 Tax=Armillaria novae-zelandiae TaxID=153914 RepID=A0AA39NY07_9AGAR|nr:permease for cytosine/purines, uracil, thiamine, allantoin-domain-containing protein [Armillaria novae-zelandiae]